MDGVFGLDFGTTNSVISLVQRDSRRGGAGHRVISLLNQDDRKPHPSVAWYSADGVVVGRKARDQMSEVGIGVFGDIVRSPKMFLGSPAPIAVGGLTRSAEDVVSDVLSFLKQDALGRKLHGQEFNRAVVTIPVGMQGPGRRALREAANKAGIRVHRFVHEPLAALYGYLRSTPDFAEQVARLEGRLALVFDWGGGTLDLTLCKFTKGTLVQVMNVGDSEVGGDQFDLRIRGLVRERHQVMHPTADWNRIQPTAEARMIKACEDAKIALSELQEYTIYIPHVLATEGPARDLEIKVSRSDLRQSVEDLTRRGLGAINRLVEAAGIPLGAIEFCLATGGMVAMPSIREGLLEMLGASRFRTASDSATIISEGAAWIAHDNVRLGLAKPLEILHADDCYVAAIPARTLLPEEDQQIEQSMGFYAVDPRDGRAKFQLARPRWPGRESSADTRIPYTHMAVEIDPFAAPLFERLDLRITIDHNMIATASARASLSNDKQAVEIWDLEFGLALAPGSAGPGSEEPKTAKSQEASQSHPSPTRSHVPGSVRIRSNVIDQPHAWSLVPGDIIKTHATQLASHQYTPKQHEEMMYYAPCSECGRTIYEIERDGCDRCAARGHTLSRHEAAARWKQVHAARTEGQKEPITP